MVCRQRTVEPTTLEVYAADMEHDGRKYRVELANFDVLQCKSCGARVLDDAANDRLFEGLRAAAGLLTPAEIRRQREALGLRQKDLANLLQISEYTLSRWETGAQMQQRCMDRILRAFFALDELRRFLGMGPSTANVAVQQPLTTGIAAGGSFFSPSAISWPVSAEMAPAPPTKPTDPHRKFAA